MDELLRKEVQESTSIDDKALEKNKKYLKNNGFGVILNLVGREIQ